MGLELGYHFQLVRSVKDHTASVQEQSLIGSAIHATVVVADDHPLLRKAMCSLLRSRSNFKECVEAADGNEAVLKSLELNPGLIILDVSMPVLDGFGAAKKIKEVLPKVSILMFTADASPELSQIAQSVGAQGIVRKTELSEVLLQAVDALLAGKTFFPNGDLLPSSTCTTTPNPIRQGT
jgi:DNA-binding NarL/FixJ family response regulator